MVNVRVKSLLRWRFFMLRDICIKVMKVELFIVDESGGYVVLWTFFRVRGEVGFDLKLNKIFIYIICFGD